MFHRKNKNPIIRYRIHDTIQFIALNDVWYDFDIQNSNHGHSFLRTHYVIMIHFVPPVGEWIWISIPINGLLYTFSAQLLGHQALGIIM